MFYACCAWNLDGSRLAGIMKLCLEWGGSLCLMALFLFTDDSVKEIKSVYNAMPEGHAIHNFDGRSVKFIALILFFLKSLMFWPLEWCW